MRKKRDLSVFFVISSEIIYSGITNTSSICLRSYHSRIFIIRMHWNFNKASVFLKFSSKLYLKLIISKKLVLKYSYTPVSSSTWIVASDRIMSLRIFPSYSKIFKNFLIKFICIETKPVRVTTYRAYRIFVVMRADYRTLNQQPDKPTVSLSKWDFIYLHPKICEMQKL